jgi:cyclopropane fatty-acyl-phospholipid synthase-like methyltransferase
MPKLESPLHLDMLKQARAQGQPEKQGLYGLHWGDPESHPPLRHIRDEFLLPFVNAGKTAVEIGPGGGRWTRYMLGFKKLYAVDFHPELLDELKKNFDRPNIEYIKNNGTDFPGIPKRKVDFLFTFGVFVHLDLDIISSYLENARSIMKKNGDIVIQYSDKNKPLAQQNKGFSENTPEKMRELVASHGYRIIREDTTTLLHSSVIHLRP